MTANLHAPNTRESVVLPDGNRIDFDIHRSSRRRSVGLRVCADGLVITAPHRMPTKLIAALVARKARWIAKRLAQFEETRHLSTVPAVRPDAFELAGLNESWQVDYRATDKKSVSARVGKPGHIVLSGAVDDVDACHAALRRWLIRHAKHHLAPWLSRVAQETRLTFCDVAIKNQRSRWGSCTKQGRISLNCKLLFFPPELVRYVLVHELCHTIEHNHSGRFWALVKKFEPDSDASRARVRDAWKWVPSWA